MYFSTGLIFLLTVLDILVYYLQKQQEEDNAEQNNSSSSSSSSDQRFVHKKNHVERRDSSSSDQRFVHKEDHVERKDSSSSSSDQQFVHKEDHVERKDPSSSSSSSLEKHCHRFSLAEIKLATHDFDDAFVIGEGGFGKVYKGTIDFGGRIDVAIKRLDIDSNQGETEFWAEIEMLSKFRHSHIVSLLGYHVESGKREMILVYEYLPNGSLEDHLHKGRANGGSFSPLTWVQRLRICIDAARGLDYLHTGTGIRCRVIHRDVKSSNILLDENWAGKIADFGLSRTGPAYQSCTTNVYTNQIRGTFGYMDALYFATHRLTRKSDVYAFGVVLFEVLCGRPAVDFTLDEKQHSLAAWAKHCVEEGTIDQFVDPCLRGELSTRCLKEFAKIAYKCLLWSPKDRPTMTEVVARLEFVLALALQKHGRVTIVEKARSLFMMKLPVVPSNPKKKAIKKEEQWQGFPLDKWSGKNCYMLGARGLSITWGNDPRYWQWISVPDSRFPEVAELMHVCWLAVQGTINTAMLSADTCYVAYLVYKSTLDAYGFEDQPVEVSMGINGAENETKPVFLDHEAWQRQSSAAVNGPKRRQDGWLEIELGEYLNKEGEEGEVEMSMREVKRLYWKGGLIIQGIEIRPKSC